MFGVRCPCRIGAAASTTCSLTKPASIWIAISDSWRRLQAALIRHDIREVRRVSAVNGSRLELPATWRHSAGAYGCLLSHLQVVRDARKRGLPGLLILEDDVVFDPSFSEKFPVFIRDLPADWDMLFLGALQREDPVPVAEHVVRIRRAYSTYAYALRGLGLRCVHRGQ